MKWTLAALCAALVIGGCSKKIDNSEAVRQGVVDYLQGRTEKTGLDMKLMEVSVSNVTFKDNEAAAMVMFKPKGGGSDGMSMNYVLERRGDKWVVKGRKESGANAHGQGMPGMQASPGAMGGQAPGMPPNHPPVQPATPSGKQ